MRNEAYEETINAVLFKRLYGVKPETFKNMKQILQKAFDQLHKRGGKPPKLTVEDKLRVTLRYLREYRTMESIGADYGVGKSAICEAIQWVEDTLAQDKAYQLPKKRVLKANPANIKHIVVDVTESPINRPQKNRESGIPERKNVIR